MKLFILGLLILGGLAVYGQNTDSIYVYGNCGMCKSRIEKAVKLDGVSAAEWSSKTKILTVTYDPARISNEAIQKTIAAVGHDTEKYEADDAVYDKLPGCCHYKRKRDSQNGNN